MVSRIKRYINKSDFIKNLLTLVSGTAVAQALPILASPILSRLYTPQEFGTLAVFVSIVMIFGTIANGRYEMAVMLPEKDSDALNLLALGVIVSSILSILLLIFILFFHDTIIIWLKNADLKNWIYLLPPVIFLLGLFNMLNYYNIRIKEYKSIAVSKIFKSSGTVVIQLIMGIFKTGYIGLLIGFSFANFFGNIKLLKNSLKDKSLLNEVKLKQIKFLAKRYLRFPKLNMPATLANKLSTELTNILVSTVFNVVTLGLFSFAQKMLSVPSSFIGTSVGDVFMQEAAYEKHKTGKAEKIYRAVLRKLTLIGLIFFGILFFVAEDVFAFVFGEEWRLAGYYAKIMMPLLLVRFIVSPVSVSLSVFEKQHITLFWHLGLFILSMLIIASAFIIKLDFTQFLYIYVGVLTVYYLILLIILQKVVKGEK